MRVNKEEVFGPMTCIMRVDSYEEGLSLANDTEYGLSASIITNSVKEAQHYKRNAKFGSVLGQPSYGRFGLSCAVWRKKCIKLWSA